MSEPTAPAPSFADLGLPDPLLQSLAAVGYEHPTPIQAGALPVLLAGRDLLGHAPTGTGKTAAFALPALARSKPGEKGVRTLVLTPTRELAIQVAEAFASYASRMPGFRVLPIYGGQEYGTQIRQLSRGVQVVVGTPGRVMDHLKRGTLDLGSLDSLVLDEADEMLRMGFIDDVEWILEQTPAARQTALFSATMPKPIARIARKHLRDPVEIAIEGKRETAAAIHQRYWLVSGLQKLDALTRILEVERFDGMLIFVRTRTQTVELAEKLEARGFASAAINGDMAQKQREQTVEKLKRGSIDILVATDVVARGLDVDRISHVVNFDIPYDTEAYVHRIGRTGRAGRSGEAILFVTPRERGLLGAIERATASRIEPLTLPSIEAVNERRVEDFKASIVTALDTPSLGRLQSVIESIASEQDVPLERVAAALAHLALGDRPLYAVEERKASKRAAAQLRTERGAPETRDKPAKRSGKSRDEHSDASTRDSDSPARESRPAPQARVKRATRPGIEMERFRVEIGAAHGVKAQHLVGAIANEANLDAAWIGKIRIEDEHSVIELPRDMPKPVLRELRKAWVLGRRLGISREAQAASTDAAASHHAPEGDRPAGKRKPVKPGQKPSSKGRHKLKSQDRASSVAPAGKRRDGG